MGVLDNERQKNTSFTPYYQKANRGKVFYQSWEKIDLMSIVLSLSLVSFEIYQRKVLGNKNCFGKLEQGRHLFVFQIYNVLKEKKCLRLQ